MPEEIEARWLPDGRFLLTLGKCIPVVVSSSTYFSKTQSELFVLVGTMTLLAHGFHEQHGYDLPLTSGRFVETGPGKYSLEENPAGGDPRAGAAAAPVWRSRIAPPAETALPPGNRADGARADSVPASPGTAGIAPASGRLGARTADQEIL